MNDDTSDSWTCDTDPTDRPASTGAKPTPRTGLSGTTCTPRPVAPDAAPAILSEATDDELAALAKALGHPVRVKLVRLLARRTSCVYGDLLEALPLAQSTVSQHLKVLKDAGLVRGTITGPRTCYCIEPDAIARLKSLVLGL